VRLPAQSGPLRTLISLIGALSISFESPCIASSLQGPPCSRLNPLSIHNGPRACVIVIAFDRQFVFRRLPTNSRFFPPPAPALLLLFNLSAGKTSVPPYPSPISSFRNHFPTIVSRPPFLCRPFCASLHHRYSIKTPQNSRRGPSFVCNVLDSSPQQLHAVNHHLVTRLLHTLPLFTVQTLLL
jgi:hypothetical protein